MQREVADTSDVKTPRAAPVIDEQTLDAKIEGLSLDEHYGCGTLGYGQQEIGHNGTVDTQISSNDIGQDACDWRSSADHAQDADLKSQDTACQHERIVNALKAQLDNLEKDRAHLQHQLGALRKDNEALGRQVRALHLQLSEGSPQLKEQIATLKAEKRALEAEINEAHHEGLMDGLRSQCAQNERVILVQQVEAYKKEANKWKLEALSKGAEAVSTYWQIGVDQAVGKKRDADMLAFRMLQQENEALRAEKRE